jgi:hypothetical protein
MDDNARGHVLVERLLAEGFPKGPLLAEIAKAAGAFAAAHERCASAKGARLDERRQSMQDALAALNMLEHVLAKYRRAGRELEQRTREIAETLDD